MSWLGTRSNLLGVNSNKCVCFLSYACHCTIVQCKRTDYYVLQVTKSVQTLHDWYCVISHFGTWKCPTVECLKSLHFSSVSVAMFHMLTTEMQKFDMNLLQWWSYVYALPVQFFVFMYLLFHILWMRLVFSVYNLLCLKTLFAKWCEVLYRHVWVMYLVKNSVYKLFVFTGLFTQCVCGMKKVLQKFRQLCSKI